jgi:D-aminoacyl-tRNA deacylase
VIALIQRVAEAQVEVGGEIVGKIGRGLLALIGVERGDGELEATRLAEKMLGFRVFADPYGKMNFSVIDIQGAVLAVPQFTLAAETRSGTRPSFSSAASPEDGERLFRTFVEKTSGRIKTETGRFGAHMRVSLVNDGPVTFWLQFSPLQRS